MIDTIDKYIIAILSKDSRTPFLQIAGKLKISESTVRNRVKNLIKHKVIRKFSVDIEPSKLGYECVAIVGVDIMSERYLEVSKKISQLEEVKYAATSGGDHMMMLQVWAKNNDELHSINEKLKSISGVTRICPAIIKETLKKEI